MKPWRIILHVAFPPDGNITSMIMIKGGIKIELVFLRNHQYIWYEESRMEWFPINLDSPVLEGLDL